MLTLNGYGGKFSYLHLAKPLKLKKFKKHYRLKHPNLQTSWILQNVRGAAVRFAGKQIQVNSGWSGTRSGRDFNPQPPNFTSRALTFSAKLPLHEKQSQKNSYISGNINSVPFSEKNAFVTEYLL